jgi:hypothetical protein
MLPKAIICLSPSEKQETKEYRKPLKLQSLKKIKERDK